MGWIWNTSKKSTEAMYQVNQDPISRSTFRSTAKTLLTIYLVGAAISAVFVMATGETDFVQAIANGLVGGICFMFLAAPVVVIYKAVQMNKAKQGGGKDRW